MRIGSVVVSGVAALGRVEARPADRSRADPPPGPNGIKPSLADKRSEEENERKAATGREPASGKKKPPPWCRRGGYFKNPDFRWEPREGFSHPPKGRGIHPLIRGPLCVLIGSEIWVPQTDTAEVVAVTDAIIPPTDRRATKFDSLQASRFPCLSSRPEQTACLNHPRPRTTPPFASIRSQILAWISATSSSRSVLSRER